MCLTANYDHHEGGRRLIETLIDDGNNLTILAQVKIIVENVT